MHVAPRALRALAVTMTAVALATPVAAQTVLVAETALNSQYQWRGLTTTNRPVWQPDAKLIVPTRFGSLTGSVFASLEGGRYDDPTHHISENGGQRSGLAEYDLILEGAGTVGRLGWVLGATTYSYPNELGTTSSANTAEVYAKASWTNAWTPTLAVWQDVHAIHGAYAEFSVARPVGSFVFGALGGYNISQTHTDTHAGYFARQGPTHADVSIARPITVGSITATPNVHWIIGNDAATRTLSPVHAGQHKIWLGTTVTWTRALAKAAEGQANKN